jgi:hypothetical protein
VTDKRRPRGAKAFVHGGGSVVVVPARVAAWLDNHGLSGLRVNAREADPEVDAILAALHLASLSWRTSVSAEPASEVAGTRAEAAPRLTWMNSNQAADRLGITSRGVRLPPVPTTTTEPLANSETDEEAAMTHTTQAGPGGTASADVCRRGQAAA